jgi:hypothetical protein
VHASISYAHAEGIQNEHLKNTKTDAHAEHARQELMHMLKTLWSKNHQNPSHRKSHTWAPLRAFSLLTQKGNFSSCAILVGVTLLGGTQGVTYSSNIRDIFTDHYC